jgi:PAS domain S-box-containing protein
MASRREVPASSAGAMPRNTDESYRMLAENSPDLIARFDTRLRHLYVNPAAARAGKLSASEYTGLTIAESGVPEPVAATWDHRIGEVLRTGRMMDVEDAFSIPEGVRYFLTRLTPELTPDGSVCSVLSVARDITERKLTEQALRESEARKAAMLESALDCIVAVDSAGNITEFNRAAEKTFGYRREDVIGKKMAALLIPPTLREQHRAGVMRYKATGQSTYLGGPTERMAMRADGTEFPVTLAVAPLTAPGVTGFVGVIRDITERKFAELASKNAEEALRESEARFRSVAVNTPDHIVFQDRDLRYRLVINPQLGLTEADMIGRTDRDILGKEDAKKLTSIKRKVLESGQSVHLETSLQNSKGETELFEGAYVPRFDAAGQADGLIGYFRNITGRKRAEDALRNREDMLQRIFDILPVGLWFADKDGKLLRGNPAGVKIWGAEPRVNLSEFGIFKARRLPSGEELAPDDWALAHTIRDKVTIVDELLEIDAFDGQKKTILNFTAPVLDAQGEVQGAIIVNEDVTERKRTEKRMQLFSKEIITAREEERRQVSSVLHHDVGSMAVGISAHLDAIEEDLRSGKPGEALKWMKRTRKLFDHSMVRLKGLAVQLRPPELDVLGLCAALRQHFSQATKNRGVRIHFRENLVRRRVSGDTATLLFRVAQEALTNAITHGHAKRVDVTLRALKKEIRLTVRDDGKGFDPSEHLAREKSQMGLRVMQEMAISAGGAFAIESGRKKGTTVRVSLPYARAKRGGA